MPRPTRLFLWTTWIAATLVATGSIGCGPSTDSTTKGSSKRLATGELEPAMGGSLARRTIKNATDADASKIEKTPKDITIEEISTQKASSGVPEAREGPFETQTWRVKGTLRSVQLLKDGEIFLTLTDAANKETIVALPDPKQCQGSPLLSEITSARKQIEDRFQPTTSPKTIAESVTVTGVGCLGWGNQAGKARNGPRLMPATGFEFSHK